MKKLMFIFAGLLTANITYAALLNTAEKTLLQKVQTSKITFQQSRQVVAVLNKYAKNKKIPFQERGNAIKKIIQWLINQ